MHNFLEMAPPGNVHQAESPSIAAALPKLARLLLSKPDRGGHVPLLVRPAAHVWLTTYGCCLKQHSNAFGAPIKQSLWPSSVQMGRLQHSAPIQPTRVAPLLRAVCAPEDRAGDVPVPLRPGAPALLPRQGGRLHLRGRDAAAPGVLLPGGWRCVRACRKAGRQPPGVCVSAQRARARDCLCVLGGGWMGGTHTYMFCSASPAQPMAPHAALLMLQGDVVMREGESGDTLWFVAEGELEVQLCRHQCQEQQQQPQRQQPEEGGGWFIPAGRAAAQTTTDLAGKAAGTGAAAGAEPITKARMSACTPSLAGGAGDSGGQCSVLGVLRAGDHFGEWSTLLGQRRTATVVARTPCECYSLSRASVGQVLAQLPELAADFESMLQVRSGGPECSLAQFVHVRTCTGCVWAERSRAHTSLHMLRHRAQYCYSHSPHRQPGCPCPAALLPLAVSSQQRALLQLR